MLLFKHGLSYPSVIHKFLKIFIFNKFLMFRYNLSITADLGLILEEHMKKKKNLIKKYDKQVTMYEKKSGKSKHGCMEKENHKFGLW